MRSEPRSPGKEEGAAEEVPGGEVPGTLGRVFGGPGVGGWGGPGALISAWLPSVAWVRGEHVWGAGWVLPS